MLKKVLFLASVLSFLSASNFVTLENGKTILLKDNGTYEEVTLIKKDGKMIALKKDGTWESVDEDVVVAQTVVNKKSKALYRAKNSKLAKELIGKWVSPCGKIAYTFKKDGQLIIKDGVKLKKSTYKVEDVDEKRRNIVVNVGEEGNLGFISFGGDQWILHIDEDGKTMHNESLKLRSLKDVVLIKQ